MDLARTSLGSSKTGKPEKIMWHIIFKALGKLVNTVISKIQNLVQDNLENPWENMWYPYYWIHITVFQGVCGSKSFNSFVWYHFGYVSSQGWIIMGFCLCGFNLTIFSLFLILSPGQRQEVTSIQTTYSISLFSRVFVDPRPSMDVYDTILDLSTHKTHCSQQKRWA